MSSTEYTHRLRLLDMFHEFGLHPRLLSYLRGRTEDEEWASLERLVNTWPHADPGEVFRSGWPAWWTEPGVSDATDVAEISEPG